MQKIYKHSRRKSNFIFIYNSENANQADSEELPE